MIILEYFYKNKGSNAYEQYVPQIAKILDSLLKEKLSEIEFPYIDRAPNRSLPDQIMIFINGGVTFAELKAIENMKQNFPNKNIILGGSNLLNSSVFISSDQNI